MAGRGIDAERVQRAKSREIRLERREDIQAEKRAAEAKAQAADLRMQREQQAAETGRTQMRQTGETGRTEMREQGLGLRQQKGFEASATAADVASERAAEGATTVFDRGTERLGQRFGAQAYFAGASPGIARQFSNSGFQGLNIPEERYDPYREPAKKELFPAVRELGKEITPAMTWDSASGEYKQAVDSTYADVGNEELLKRIEELRKQATQGLR